MALWMSIWHIAVCAGASHCTQGDLMLQVSGRLSSQQPDEPAADGCGHGFCEALREGSWCKTNGLCQWTDVPCGCSGTTTSATTATTITTTTTRTTTTATTTTTTTTTSESGTSTSFVPSTTGGACGDQLCTSLRSGSWCKANGVCQWTDTPCRCLVTSSTPSTTSTSSATSTTPSTTSTGTQSPLHERYVQIPKALYVWNPGDLSHSWWDWTAAKIDLLLSVCRMHGFKRAIVFIGSVQWDWEQHFAVRRLPHQDKFVTLFAELRRVGVMPYACFYLNDSPNNLANWERAADVVSAVHNFNEAFPQSKIEGLDGDQEPTHVSEDYLKMNQAMMARRDSLRSPLHITVSIKPGWLRSTIGKTLAAEKVLDSVDAGMMMAYSSQMATSLQWGDQALALGEVAKAAVSVAIETSFRAPRTDSLWELAQEPMKFFQLVVDMDDHYRGRFASVFQGMVVHDYEGFFKAMYGVAATAYMPQVESLHG